MAIVAIGISLLVATTVLDGRPGTPAVLAVAIRVGAGLFMAWLLLAALLMSGLGCDDTCGYDGPWWEDRDAWQWQAQLWLALAAAGLWALTARWPSLRRALIPVSVALIAGWTVLLLPVEQAPV